MASFSSRRSTVATSANSSDSSTSSAAADRGEQLRRRFLLAALDLGQVAEAHPGAGRDLAQRAALPQAQRAEGVTDHLTKHWHDIDLLERSAPAARCVSFTVPAGADARQRVTQRRPL